MRRRSVSGFCAALFTVTLAAACSEPPPPPPPPTAAQHETTVNGWHESRLSALMQPIGWLSLAGLYWIEPGPNTFGAAADNAFVYAPAARPQPDRIGTFMLAGDEVRFDAAEVGAVRSDSGDVVSTPMHAGENHTVLRSGSLEWRVMRRNDRLAVRLWDTLSEVRTEFPGIDRFPVTLAWRFPARFIAHDPPDTIDVPNILGTIGRTPSPGSVEFTHNGRDYTLRTWKDSDDPANFFTAFADRTNGAATYGGGRFLWIDAPDENGWTVVDFNRSYNPPCVFTDYATCPLPPRQNQLPFAIEAGERAYAAH